MLPGIEERKIEIANNAPPEGFVDTRLPNDKLANEMGHYVCAEVLNPSRSMFGACSDCLYKGGRVGMGYLCMEKVLNTIRGVLNKRNI